jgi:transposase InsO family protein
MSVRRLIIEVELEGLNVAQFCRLHGVSRWFFYDLRRRYALDGEAALELGSRAPKTVANRTPQWLEDLIIEQRKHLESQGLDAGPGTIVFHLAQAGTEPPSEATIWRVLTRWGFVIPAPEKAPKHSYRRFQAERANQLWQIDDTPWSLADGTPVQIINLIDDCTRVVLASQATFSCNTDAAFRAFCEGASSFGWPARFLSDNAKEFCSGLASALRPLGVDSSHSRPFHPQTCGKVERFHHTLHKWLWARPRVGTLDELQIQLDQFRTIYNHHRPHRSLGRQIPAQVFAATPKDGPAGRPLGEPTTIHRVKISGGTVSIGQRLLISVGAKYTGEIATVIITGSACHVFVAGRLIRQLTLDHNRRVQPIYDRRGRPKVTNQL